MEKVTVSLVIDKDIIEKAKVLCEKQDRSLSSLMRLALEEMLKQQPEGV